MLKLDKGKVQTAYGCDSSNSVASYVWSNYLSMNQGKVSNIIVCFAQVPLCKEINMRAKALFRLRMNLPSY